MSDPEYDARVAALDGLYAKRLPRPQVECKGFCAVYCKQIPMSQTELERIEHFRGPIGEYPEDGTCPMLTADQRCGIYEIRPLVCRLFGESMRVGLLCEWGCQPSRMLTSEETDELMA